MDGIGSPFFTRRMETSTQNVLQLMQRPGAYDVGGRNDWIVSHAGERRERSGARGVLAW